MRCELVIRHHAIARVFDDGGVRERGEFAEEKRGAVETGQDGDHGE